MTRTWPKADGKLCDQACSTRSALGMCPGGAGRARRANFALDLSGRKVVPALLWLWLVMVLALSPQAFALDPRRALTQYQSRSWGPENGLPCNNVLAVTQSSDGYLWLGTEEGLVRFDGVRARVFDRQINPVLGGNNVASVVEDRRRPGQLLLSGAVGVRRFITGEEVRTLSSDSTLARQSGQILMQDPLDGALWVKTARGLFRVGHDDGSISGPFEAASGWPAEMIRTVCRDRAGRLWVGTVRGVYRQHQDEEDDGLRFDLLPDWAGKAVDHLASARGGGLWVGSRWITTARFTPTRRWRDV